MTDKLRATTVLRHRRPPGVEHVEVDGETVVYDCDHDALHVLDRVGSLVWSMLDGRRTVHEVGLRLAERFEASPDGVLRDVSVFAAELERIHLVERL